MALRASVLALSLLSLAALTAAADPFTWLTAPTALILARVFGNSADFWLNVQRRTDLWEAMHSPRERERIRRAKPLRSAA